MLVLHRVRNRRAFLSVTGFTFKKRSLFPLKMQSEEIRESLWVSMPLFIALLDTVVSVIRDSIPKLKALFCKETEAHA